MRTALFIGGTGTISTAVVRRLAKDPEWNVWILNRGSRKNIPDGVQQIIADAHNEAQMEAVLGDRVFDCVCDFIAFRQEDVERDVRLFRDRARQFIFTSSASAYHKPAASYVVSEGTSLANPYWEYSRNKIACEEYLMHAYRTTGFPVTIVRPSHTYDERKLPVAVHGQNGSWQVIRRMLEGKPVIIPGDGSSLWTVTFNEDFAVGYTGLMGNVHAIGEAFQITGDETLTWNQIYQTIADALHVPLHACHVSSDFLAKAGEPYGYDFQGELLGDKAVSVVFDNAKLKRLVPAMGTTVPFHAGVQIALEYILEHPECQKVDPAFDAWCDRIVEAQERALREVIQNSRETQAQEEALRQLTREDGRRQAEEADRYTDPAAATASMIAYQLGLDDMDPDDVGHEGTGPDQNNAEKAGTGNVMMDRKATEKDEPDGADTDAMPDPGELYVMHMLQEGYDVPNIAYFLGIDEAQVRKIQEKMLRSRD